MELFLRLINWIFRPRLGAASMRLMSRVPFRSLKSRSLRKISNVSNKARIFHFRKEWKLSIDKKIYLIFGLIWCIKPTAWQVWRKIWKSYNVFKLSEPARMDEGTSPVREAPCSFLVIQWILGLFKIHCKMKCSVITWKLLLPFDRIEETHNVWRLLILPLQSGTGPGVKLL